MSGMTLYGADDVVRAGGAMQEAASAMRQAASAMEDCTRRLELLFGSGYGSVLEELVEALGARKEES